MARRYRLFYDSILYNKIDFFIQEVDALLSDHDDGEDDTKEEAREIIVGKINEFIEALNELKVDVKKLGVRKLSEIHGVELD